MGCIQSTSRGSKEESKSLTKTSSQTPTDKPKDFTAPNIARLSTHIPQTGPLTQQDYWDRIEYCPSETTTSGRYSLEFSWVSQRGYYPNEVKANQDAVFAKANFGGNPNQHFFGVFDGHGACGHAIAQFAKEKIPENLEEYPRLQSDPHEALKYTMTWTNEQLHNFERIDDLMSGTTAVCCLFQNETVHVANVGDSRAIVVSKKNGRLIANPLSKDQTPFRKDELARVREAGAVVLTLDQMEGMKSREYEDWTEEADGGDPPRLWKPRCQYPGTAFTRSIGDAWAEEIGVVADPELETLQLTPEHTCIIIASDGVTEFLTNEQIAELVSEYEDPQEAAMAMIVESYKHWLQHEQRTDDISAVVIYIKKTETEAAKPDKTKNAKKGLKKTFGSHMSLHRKQDYQNFEDEGGLLTSKSNASLQSFSSRYLSDDEPTPRRVLARMESRSRHKDGGSPKMSVPPDVIEMSSRSPFHEPEPK